jgi:predicted acylesterase/phospholipase RssA
VSVTALGITATLLLVGAVPFCPVVGALLVVFSLLVLGPPTIALSLRVMHGIKAKIRSSCAKEAIRKNFRAYVPQLHVKNGQSLRRSGCSCHFYDYARAAFDHLKEFWSKMAAGKPDKEKEVIDATINRLSVQFEKELKEFDHGKYSRAMCYNCMATFLECADWELCVAVNKVQPKNVGKFSRISFSGGGGKGCGYLALMAWLQEKDVGDFFEEDLEFSGASVGSLCAACAAFKIKGKQLENTILSALGVIKKKATTDQLAMYPAVQKSSAGFFGGLSLVEIMDKLITDAVQKYLQTLSEEYIKTLPPPQQLRIGLLKEPFRQGKSREPHMLTFRDLDMLRGLPAGKEFFHRLHVIVHDCSDGKEGKTKCFGPNCPEKDDMRIVYALRASAALPIFFTPYKGSRPAVAGSGEGTDSAQTNFIFADGGISNNTATMPFRHYQDGRTLALTFEAGIFGASVKDNPAKFGGIADAVMTSVMKLASFPNDFAKKKEEDLRELVEMAKGNPLSVFFVPYGETGTIPQALDTKTLEAIRHQVECAIWYWTWRMRYDLSEYALSAN